MNLWMYDPGGTTGYAHFKDGKLLEWGEFSKWLGIDSQVHEGDTVAYEKASVRTPAFHPVVFEVIGVIKYLSQKNNCMLLERHPSQIVGIQKWPVYNLRVISSIHARDAVCHGIILLGGPYHVVVPKALLKTSNS